jgi:hypothetical protein
LLPLLLGLVCHLYTEGMNEWMVPSYFTHFYNKGIDYCIDRERSSSVEVHRADCFSSVELHLTCMYSELGDRLSRFFCSYSFLVIIGAELAMTLQN